MPMLCPDVSHDMASVSFAEGTARSQVMFVVMYMGA